MRSVTARELRGLALALSVAASSCTSFLNVSPSAREPTELTSGTEIRLADRVHEMAVAWDGMRRGRASVRRAAEDRYNRALALFLGEWDQAQSPRYWRSGTEFTTRDVRFRVEFDTDGKPWREVSPAQIDELVFPSRVKLHEVDTLAQRHGMGVPVVGHIRRTVEERAQHPFLPPNGGNLTITALMEFDEAPQDSREPRRCRLRLYDALNVETVQMRGGERQLAANFTAAKELALSKKTLSLFALTGILRPELALDDCQLYLMDPYDPRRIPVVFVHGLMSDPHIWLNMVNAISADPELRAAYQPWYFLYPTAMSIPQSAGKLRESLRAVLQRHDPDHNDPGSRQMVLVGHSMGGLLSRMQVIDPKDRLWNALLQEPPDELQVSDRVKERLKQNLMFQPQPEVSRLIFITTPHRGSNLASKNIVRRLASLIRLPVDTLLMSEELLSGNTDALSPQIRDWGIYSFLSLGMLSEKHPYYQGLNSIPIPVKHHSIIGDRGRKDSFTGSDGVVPYWSSHLDTAKSEKIVPHGHRCVQQNDVVKEVMRVLKKHLEENGTVGIRRS